jgi:hypothetical protein
VAALSHDVRRTVSDGGPGTLPDRHAQEAGLLGLDDPAILEAAIQRGAIFVTFNQRHFYPLHHAWQDAGRQYTGILLSRQLRIEQLYPRLERSARLLAPEVAHNQLLVLDLFDTEARAGLTRLPPPAATRGGGRSIPQRVPASLLAV